MNRFALGALGVVVLMGGMGTAVTAQQPPLPWNQCCGTTPWPMGSGMMERGMMGPGMMGSMPRHHAAMMGGVPDPYRDLSNPLPRTKATIDRGAKVYAANCSSCHGPTGQGDGKAVRGSRRRQAILRGYRKCRCHDGTHSCIGQSLKVDLPSAQRCHLSKRLYRKKIFGRS